MGSGLPGPLAEAARAGRRQVRRVLRRVRLARLRRGPRVRPTDGVAVLDGDRTLLVPDPTVSRLSRRLVERGVTEPDVTDMARLLATPGSVVLDVGASIGYYTVLLASWVGPSGRIIAHEPWPLARSYLEANLARNGLANVTQDPRALADVSGEGHMAPPAYRLSLGPATDPAALPVTAARFDDLAAAAGLDRLDLVKMDIEGAEGRALAGMVETFRRLRPILLLEVHPDMLPNHGDDVTVIHRFLDDLGYRRLVVEADGDERTGHHLVAAPAERLAGAGLLPTGPRRPVLQPDARAWTVAPGSPASVLVDADGTVQARGTRPDRPGYVVDGPGWWQRPPAPGQAAARPSSPTWLAWDGGVPAAATARAWVFEYAGQDLRRRRAIALPDGSAEWRFLSGPDTCAVRLALEVGAGEAVTVRRLALEQAMARPAMGSPATA